MIQEINENEEINEQQDVNENEGEKAQNNEHYLNDMDTIRSKSDDKNSLLDESFMER